MRFIRKGGRVIPISDGSPTKKGAIEGAKAFGKAGAFAGTITAAGAVATGAVVAKNVSHLAWKNGNALLVSISPKPALKFIAKQGLKWGAIGAVAGAGIGALTGERKYGKRQ